MTEPKATLVLGLHLRLTTEAEGGRRAPLGLPGVPLDAFQYRPDWSLPHGPDGLTAAPVFGFSRTPVSPGEPVRAVITPLWPKSLVLWRALNVGDVLRMHEGPRVCGLGTVVWLREVTWPLIDPDLTSVQKWLADDLD